MTGFSKDVILQVADLDAATRFYADVLGVAVTKRDARLVSFEGAELNLFVYVRDPFGLTFNLTSR